MGIKAAPDLITIVGCGPGSPDYLTPAARQAVAKADVLLGAQRLHELFPDYVGLRLPFDADMARLVRTLQDLRPQYRHITVLVTGDPGLFSLTQALVRAFGRTACRVIPAVSSVQVAFARLALDWADARILSAHGRIPEEKPEVLRPCDKLAVLAGTAAAMQWIGELAAALQDTHAALVCRDLTLPGEEVVEIKGGTGFQPVSGLTQPASSLTLVLLIRRSLLV